jgi:tRNA (5-methylaminomethyl-2-thiouridylate)-methyltransferase
MKIAVLVSGGVDSSVALRLLHAQGHQVVPFYLKIWLEDELSYLGQCPWQEDLAYAIAVCNQIGIELRVLSLQREYHETVVAYTIQECRAGRTPNPDIMCNTHIKFGFFLDAIKDEQFDAIATGHYAQIGQIDDWIVLKRSVDSIKDQTYFLAHLSQKQLQKVLFPIGNLTKKQVREYAQTFDLPNKARKDSQGICFLGKIKFREFVKHHLGTQPGPFIEHETGKIVGMHEGCWFYTIGQRQGIGLSGGPWYVLAKRIDRNEIIISRDYYSDHHQRRSFVIKKVHWIGSSYAHIGDLSVKMRHGQSESNAKITLFNEEGLLVELSSNDQGIAVGQFAVFYYNDLCIGSGSIDLCVEGQ